MSAGSPGLLERVGAFSSKHSNCVLAVSSCSRPPALVLSVDGELDSNDSNDFQEIALLAFAEARPQGALVLDLASLGYVSSMGIGVLVTLLAESKKTGLPLYLRSLPEHARSIMDLLGFASLFDLLDGEAP